MPTQLMRILFSIFNFYSSSSECLDSTLNVLARALENNKENPEIWCHYLRLFSKRGTKEEIQEMCETAVEYAPSYQIWWTVSKNFKVYMKCSCKYVFSTV